MSEEDGKILPLILEGPVDDRGRISVTSECPTCHQLFNRKEYLNCIIVGTALVMCPECSNDDRILMSSIPYSND